VKFNDSVRAFAPWRWVFLVALLVAACSQENFRGRDIEGGGDFELLAHTGARVKAADFRGKALVVFFGYTHCPDICAPTLTQLAQAVGRLGDDAAQVQVVLITVDPQRDTPAQLARFVPNFHPAFVGLTGTAQELAAVAREYRVPFDPHAHAGQHIAHSSTILIKDRQGKLRLLFKDASAPDDIAHDLRLLLKQG
jgi:protein SCO1/2